jgi:hypothetical protein
VWVAALAATHGFFKETLIMKKSAILAGLMLTVGTAHAQSNTTTAPAQAAQASATSVSSASPSIAEKITVSYLGVFYGGPVNAPVSAMQPDAATGSLSQENGAAPIFMKHYIRPYYKLSDNITAGPVVYWKTIYGKGAELQDCDVRVSHSKFLTLGNFNMAADVRLAPPTSKASQDKNAIGYVLSKQIMTYDVPETKLTVGVTTYGLARAHGVAPSDVKLAESRKDFELYVGPNVSYQLTPTVALQALYEAGASHNLNGGMVSDGTDFEPGVSWDILPSLNFNPYLDFKTDPGVGVRADNTTIGAVLSYKFL